MIFDKVLYLLKQARLQQDFRKLLTKTYNICYWLRENVTNKKKTKFNLFSI